MDGVVMDLERAAARQLGSTFSQIESGLQNMALLVVSIMKDFVT